MPPIERVRRAYRVMGAAMVAFAGGEWIVTGRVHEPLAAAGVIVLCVIGGWPR